MPRFIRNRAPNITDASGYSVNDRWIEAATGRVYRLESIVGGVGQWSDRTEVEGSIRCSLPCPHEHTADEIVGATGGGGTVNWGDIQNVPAEFPPEPHAHSFSSLTNIPSQYPPQPHGHAIADVTSLQTALDGKQAVLGFTAQDVAQKGQVNGYPSLDGTGKVPSAQLPSSAGPFVVVRKTSADQTNTTVNLANATTLLIPVLANTVYVIEGFLRMRSSLATAGFKVAFDVPALAEIVGGIYQPVSSAGAVSGALQRADALNVGATTGVDLVNQDVLVYGYWLLLNGANAGNAQLMFAAEVAATVTMRLGSTLRGMVV